VVFRILYFMIPFGIAISIMGTRELWLNVVKPWKERRRLNDGFRGPRAVQRPEPVAPPAPARQPVKRMKSQG
jgi:hypothetical protein